MLKINDYSSAYTRKNITNNKNQNFGQITPKTLKSLNESIKEYSPKDKDIATKIIDRIKKASVLLSSSYTGVLFLEHNDKKIKLKNPSDEMSSDILESLKDADKKTVLLELFNTDDNKVLRKIFSDQKLTENIETIYELKKGKNGKIIDVLLQKSLQENSFGKAARLMLGNVNKENIKFIPQIAHLITENNLSAIPQIMEKVNENNVKFLPKIASAITEENYQCVSAVMENVNEKNIKFIPFLMCFFNKDNYKSVTEIISTIQEHNQKFIPAVMSSISSKNLPFAKNVLRFIDDKNQNILLELLRTAKNDDFNGENARSMLKVISPKNINFVTQLPRMITTNNMPYVSHIVNDITDDNAHLVPKLMRFLNDEINSKRKKLVLEFFTISKKDDFQGLAARGILKSLTRRNISLMNYILKQANENNAKFIPEIFCSTKGTNAFALPKIMNIINDNNAKSIVELQECLTEGKNSAKRICAKNILLHGNANNIKYFSSIKNLTNWKNIKFINKNFVQSLNDNNIECMLYLLKNSSNDDAKGKVARSILCNLKPENADFVIQILRVTTPHNIKYIKSAMLVINKNNANQVIQLLKEGSKNTEPSSKILKVLHNINENNK